MVLADLRRALREEERLAWQRLVRVLSHEINNSLAPIHSIAASLQGALAEGAAPETWREDASNGLGVIARRSEALARFLKAHAQLAKLPPPSPAPVEIGPLVRGIAALEKRVPVGLVEGPALTVEADRDQLEQLLINLVRNAADAAVESNGKVSVGWAERADEVEISVEDDGPGLPPSPNLFVPFFTTKKDGTGLGLVLSRQIAEAHGGSLTLQNAREHRGSIARLTLPKRRTA